MGSGRWAGTMSSHIKTAWEWCVCVFVCGGVESKTNERWDSSLGETIILSNETHVWNGRNSELFKCVNHYLWYISSGSYRRWRPLIICREALGRCLQRVRGSFALLMLPSCFRPCSLAAVSRMSACWPDLTACWGIWNVIDWAKHVIKLGEKVNILVGINTSCLHYFFAVTKNLLIKGK